MLFGFNFWTWRTDITEFQIPAGKVYLSPIIDCFDGLVISWSIGTHPDAELVNTMLDAAIETVADGDARPIVHSVAGGAHKITLHAKASLAG
jgi:putative transposase